MALEGIYVNGVKQKFAPSDILDSLPVEIDPTLAIEGAAADAKAVGEALDEKVIPIIDPTLSVDMAAAEAKTVGERLRLTLHTNSLGELELPLNTEADSDSLDGQLYSAITSLGWEDDIIDVYSEIAAQAFEGDTSLTVVEFPSTVIIGNYAFNGCTNLGTAIFLKAENIGDFAFMDCTILTVLEMPEVTTIGAGSFLRDTSLTEISFPKTTTIGNAAFSYCNGVTSVSLPEAVTIGTSAFLECLGLDEIVLDKAETIGERAFEGCTGLESVTLKAVTSIGDNAFYNCAGLRNLYLNDEGITEVPTLGEDVFAGSGILETDGTIWVSADMYDDFIAASGWSAIADHINSEVA